MGIYIISFILNMLFGLSLNLNNQGRYNFNEININPIKRKIYLFVTAIQLGLICGFRSELMAYDTEEYKIIFDMCPSTWDTLFDKTSYVEVGFRVFCALIKIFGGEFQTMLIISSLFVMGSCCTFIYRHSKDVLLSVFIIISFPFFYSSFDIVRHFLATAFLLLGYKYVEERKFFKFLIFMFLGGLFQTGIWIFFPLYFAKTFKWNWKIMFFAIISTALIFVLLKPIVIFITNLLGKSSGLESGWVGEFGGGIKTALMYGIILLLAITCFYQLKDPDQKDMTAVNYILLLFVSSVIFIQARMMTRVIMTLAAFLAIAMPQLLDKSRTKSDLNYFALKFSFIIIGFVYHAFLLLTNWQNVVPYIPFWG